MISFFEERSHYLSLPFFFLPGGQVGWGVGQLYMAAGTLALRSFSLSLLVMCRVHLSAPGPPAKLPSRFSIIIPFFVVPFVSHLALPSRSEGTRPLHVTSFIIQNGGIGFVS